jgi:hypothetical protein
VERIGHDTSIVAQHSAGDSFDAFRHLRGGATRERHQENASRIGTVDNEVGNPMGERIGLAGSGACNDKQRGSWDRVLIQHSVLNGPALVWIQAFEIVCNR